MPTAASRVAPGSFEPERHTYPRVLNAQIHPLVRFFLGLSPERIVERYRHLNPKVDAQALRELLLTPPKRFFWSGCDLMHVTTLDGRRRMVVIETNSCPSGQKSMPLYDENEEQGGYRKLIEHGFKGGLLPGRRLPPGGLALIYDKNPMETTGYAAAMADAFEEPVWLVEFDQHDPDPAVRWDDGVMFVRDADGEWHPIRAAMRYLTQRPWNRLPTETRTAVLNPVSVCLAGGRNKSVASRAYDLLNAQLYDANLKVHVPRTVRDVSLAEVPLWVQSMGGRAVVKVPYSNAGQGVYTLTTPAELDAFMELEHPYERFIVQSLIGNSGWSSRTGDGVFYHVGTMPDRRARIFVSDLRMMICASTEGYMPLAVYARRAREPLTDTIEPGQDSWAMLGTNLSVKQEDGSFTTEPNRLVLMDRKDFNQLGLGIDAMVEAYVQTVLATVAIDRMTESLYTRKGRFRRRLFGSMNDDHTLLAELMA
ncbi:MAG: hypothetical protein KC613_10890 [Myxococcales bacterium]|nr:hypothetical protein [Myxococcales bacterium]